MINTQEKPEDRTWMQQCFQLAKKAIGQTTPNPYVGAVIVKDNQLLAQGYHHRSGEPHAEIMCLEEVSKKGINIDGATLYCNLEPCSHLEKKTPPCARRLIQTPLKRIVIANLDPNPQVSGRGLQELAAAGKELTWGVESNTGSLLNEVFFTHITQHRPFIHLKWAQTLDQKMATIDGHSQWITGAESRDYVHRERALYDGIGIGVKTLIHDNPQLTVRIPGKPITSPKRLIFATHQQAFTSSEKYHLFSDEFKNQTQWIDLSSTSLEEALTKLYSQGVCSLYIEGGSHLIQRFIDAQLFDRVSVYIAPQWIGPGIVAPSFITTPKTQMSDHFNFPQGEWLNLGIDQLYQSARNVCLQA